MHAFLSLCLYYILSFSSLFIDLKIRKKERQLKVCSRVFIIQKTYFHPRENKTDKKVAIHSCLETKYLIPYPLQTHQEVKEACPTSSG